MAISDMRISMHFDKQVAGKKGGPMEGFVFKVFYLPVLPDPTHLCIEETMHWLKLRNR